MPLLWAMIAFLIVVKAIDLLRPAVARKLLQWRKEDVLHDGGQLTNDAPE